jgi:hypothetical protein
MYHLINSDVTEGVDLGEFWVSGMKKKLETLKKLKQKKSVGSICV